MISLRTDTRHQLRSWHLHSTFRKTQPLLWGGLRRNVQWAKNLNVAEGTATSLLTFFPCHSWVK